MFLNIFRIAEQRKHRQSSRTKKTDIQQNCELAISSFENYGHQNFGKNHGQHLEQTISNELTSDVTLNHSPNDDILVLRDLSNPDEEFCINLSDATVPVVKRKSMIPVENFQETILANGEVHRLQDHGGITLDFEC